MSTSIKTGNFRSADGTTDIKYYSVIPSEKPKAIIQFLHGMAEHSERYREMGEFFAENGILFCINDHLGHGKSVKSESELGYFGKKDGWKYLVADAATLTGILKAEYPEAPFVIVGHSMGSFVCRAYISMNPSLADAAIIVGTGNAGAITAPGLVIAKLTAALKGSHHRSKLLDNLSFGAYNARIPNSRTAFDWLSVQNENVDKYIADPLCGFVFTVSGFTDVIKMMRFVSSEKWYSSIDKKLPMLFLAGDGDPVGNYGADISMTVEKLKAHGCENTEEKIYKNCRHEIHNEDCRRDVMLDMLEWVNKSV